MGGLALHNQQKTVVNKGSNCDKQVIPILINSHVQEIIATHHQVYSAPSCHPAESITEVCKRDLFDLIGLIDSH